MQLVENVRNFFGKYRNGDKALHIILFTVGSLGVLQLALRLPIPLGMFGRVALAGFAMALAAFLSEDAQRKQPGRTKDGWDAFADMVSFPLALAITSLF